jgi:hypothetical protein
MVKDVARPLANVPVSDGDWSQRAQEGEMPLFKAVHGTLTWDDIKGLLSREAPESELLDYKACEPKHIEPTMAAMANTYGGDILVGIAEQADGIPVPAAQVRGVAGSKGLKQSFEQKNFNIHPPILGLSVEVVPIPLAEHPDGKGDRAVVVIRIPQSDLAPHFIEGQGHFFRAGSHKRAYRDDCMPTARIQWLADRRRLHVEFRKQLVAFVDGLQYGLVYRKVWCAPRFPADSLWPDMDKEQIEGCCPLIHEEFRNRDSRVFEHYQGGKFHSRAVQHGWVWQEEWRQARVQLPGGEHEVPYCTYLVDDRGLVVSKDIGFLELAGVPSTPPDASQATVESGAAKLDWAATTARVIGVCEHARRLYEAAGYSGPVHFGLEVGVDVARSDSGRPRYDAAVLLGSTVIRAGSSGVKWSSTLTSLRSSELKMAAPEGRVAEEQVCLAGELTTIAKESQLHRRWVRAFGLVPTEEEVTDVVDAVVAAMH